MKRIGYISGGRIKGSVNLGGGGSLNAPGGIIGFLGYGFGDIFYADSEIGSSSYDGLSPTVNGDSGPKATLAQAYALCEDGKDDYIIARGSFSDSALTIAKSKLHIIGLQVAGAHRSYLTRIQSGDSASGATLLIQARDVEIAHLQVMGNRDAGKHYPAIFADGDNGGTRAYIHDCFIPMLTPSGTQYCDGIDLLGDRHTVERCVIDSCIIGVLVKSGVQATYEIMINDNIFYACDVGIEFRNLQESTGQFGGEAKFNEMNAQGANSEDRAIKVGGSGGSPTLSYNIVSGYTTPFTKGSARLINNYYNDGTAGGALIAD